MCGIVGWISEPELALEPGLLESAASRLAHRGPDGGGTWRSADGYVAFGHRRLSVIDTSDTGAQPMHSDCKRYTLVFNGEIYNHLEMRRALTLEGATPSEGWRGTSDTETLLVALRTWGPARTLEATRGMFAFALWDSATRTVTLARDRMGEKPLYVSRLPSGFAFASELKAIEWLPAFNRTISRGSLDFYLRYAYIRAPLSIYESTTKLLPGTFVTLDQQAVARLSRSGDFLAEHRKQYWSLREIASRNEREPQSWGEEEAVDELERVLQVAVKRQMLSDVPLGAFLSGGIDSTAIVAMMQATSGAAVKTFTIGFDEPSFDESPYAADVARHLGTDHTAVQLTAQDALGRVDKLPSIWDEPFADASQLPTLLVSEVARSQVTVALSGDGGDELFGGYERYRLAEEAWHKVSRVPLPLRRVMANTIRSVSPNIWDRVSMALPNQARAHFSGDRVHKVAEMIRATDMFDFYERFQSAWKGKGNLLLGDPPVSLPHWSGNVRLASMAESMMLLDSLDYMPDDVLVKVDRATMFCSLESRAPLLDNDVVEFAWSLPLHLKRRGNTGKFVLRKLVHRYVPPALVERPKMGFGVPIDEWLRGPLKSWAEDYLTVSSLTDAGLNPGPIRAAWSAHTSGTQNHQYLLWSILNYVAWRGRRVPGP